jgi:hypothetical protein
VTAPTRREIRDLLCEAAATLTDLDPDTTTDLCDRLVTLGSRVIWEGVEDNSAAK